MTTNSPSGMAIVAQLDSSDRVVGDRFYPTDEELVDHYLKRKLLGYNDDQSLIGEFNVYKVEPGELPGLSKIKSNDQVWFFISPREYMDKKRTRFNRKTKAGYWKPTGTVRKVKATRSKRVIGTKRTLVFYRDGKKTEWVMHEYEFSPDSVLCNPHEFVVIKLKKKPDEKNKKGKYSHEIDEKIKKSQLRCETEIDEKIKKSKLSCETNMSYVNENQIENEVTTNSACHGSEVISCGFGNPNSKEMTSSSVYDKGGPSFPVACTPEVQSSVTEFQEGESNPHIMTPSFDCENEAAYDAIDLYWLMVSDFDYQVSAIDQQGSECGTPPVVAVPSEIKATGDEGNSSQSVTLNVENPNLNKESEKLPTTKENWWNDLNISDIDPQLVEELETLKELRDNLN